MRRLSWVLLLVGCERGDSSVPVPAVPPPVPTPDARVVVELPRDAAVPSDAAGTSAVIDLLGIPMAGPFATRAKLCDAQTCGLDTYAECPEYNPPENKGIAMANPPAPFSEVFLQAIDCVEKPESHDPATYRIAVRRADGFYITPPIFILGFNPKYCGEGFEATWKSRDVDGNGTPDIVLTVHPHAICLSCGKQGENEDASDLLVALASSSAKPVSFQPLVTGQHYHQYPEDWISPGNDCPTIERHVTLKATWGRDNTLSLRGAPTWKRQFVESDGSIRPGAFEVDPPAPSSVGTYRFVIP
jgi:hypothetical protein